jgi:hypothetical protein
MTNKSEKEFCVQYHAHKKSCLEASGRFLHAVSHYAQPYSVICPSAESNHEPKQTADDERTYRSTSACDVLYSGCTRGTLHGVYGHRGNMLTVYTVYLCKKIGVIYTTADVYAIGLFNDLQSGSVCMHSGSYFLNKREFGFFNIFLPFVSYNIFSQVCFIHNFCYSTATVNLR